LLGEVYAWRIFVVLSIAWKLARKGRLLVENGLYHITSRGDRLESIFEDDDDRRSFLQVLGDALERFDAHALAYCLMGNHYHLVVRTRLANLPSIMRHVNGVFTQASNRRHARVGHLFQGRYHAVLIDRDAYLLEVCRYVELNPVRAGLIQEPELWHWSSYRANVGLTLPAAWHQSRFVYEQLAPFTPEVDGPVRYQRFVKEGMTIAPPQAKVMDRSQPAVRQPAGAIPPRLASNFASRAHRNEAIVLAYLHDKCSMTAIAEALGLTVAAVSKVIRQSKLRS
jgi:putative transposase